MRASLFPIQLHLLIHASPVGVEPGSPAEFVELDALARRGLLQSDALGAYRLTPSGAHLLSVNSGRTDAGRDEGSGA